VLRRCLDIWTELGRDRYPCQHVIASVFRVGGWGPPRSMATTPRFLLANIDNTSPLFFQQGFRVSSVLFSSRILRYIHCDRSRVLLQPSFRRVERLRPPKPSSLHHQQETDRASQTTARNRLIISIRKTVSYDWLRTAYLEVLYLSFLSILSHGKAAVYKPLHILVCTNPGCSTQLPTMSTVTKTLTHGCIFATSAVR
jgi:hypothetical protein